MNTKELQISLRIRLRVAAKQMRLQTMLKNETLYQYYEGEFHALYELARFYELLGGKKYNGRELIQRMMEDRYGEIH